MFNSNVEENKKKSITNFSIDCSTYTYLVRQPTRIMNKKSGCVSPSHKIDPEYPENTIIEMHQKLFLEEI